VSDIPSNDTPHPSQGDAGGMPGFIVTYTRTSDNFNGSAWPPDGDGFWSIVARANGVTTWRRVALVADSPNNEGA